ncbi:MAG: hypothetical protein EB060_05005 [Proteobacteria bacterium]|nr:hypothetical protein [Pseudomonadota bacterium]
MQQLSNSAVGTIRKVPAVTLAFWLIKIAATTFGETAGDAVSMTMNLGYAAGTGIFAVFFLASVIAQTKTQSYHPFLYWAVIVTTTTVGTTMADFATRSMGIGYTGGSLILFIALMIVLALWHFSLGSVSVDTITTPKAEAFYWATILFSNTLGTALGDFLADTPGIGYEGGALVFGGVLVLIAAAYYFTHLSHTLLFWAAFILTRPLGATLGDILTKPYDHGGLDLSRYSSSAVIAVIMIVGILLSSKKAGNH